MRSELSDFTPEYGHAIGITTPQANTTVEPEMQVLLEGSVLTARMTSPLADSRSRLVDYFDRLSETIARFDVAPLKACGFACTGSAYLYGRAKEKAAIAAASERAGYPVISAATAIRNALETLGVRRLALLSPYPKWLSEAGQQYWRDAGFDLVSVAGLPADLLDTRNIYKLSTPRVLEVFAQLDTSGADAVLLSGTGMPTLRTIAQVDPGVPVLSSNLCLAWALTAAAGGDASLSPWLAPESSWRQRLATRDH